MEDRPADDLLLAVTKDMDSNPPELFDSLSYDCSAKVFQFLNGRIHSWQEEVWILALNSHLQLIRGEMIARGTVDHCDLHPRDIFRFLILSNASTFVMAHNHPSGNTRPSREDLRATERVRKAGTLMGIPLIDHLIVSGEQFYSFADAGRISDRLHRNPLGSPPAGASERR